LLVRSIVQVAEPLSEFATDPEYCRTFPIKSN
jgi:hypothetical protein